MNVSTPAALTQHSPSHWVFFPFWKLPTHLPLQEFTSTQREVQSNENPTQDNNILWNTRHNTFLEKLLLPHFHNILNDAPPGFHITLRNWSISAATCKLLNSTKGHLSWLVFIPFYVPSIKCWPSRWLPASRDGPGQQLLLHPGTGPPSPAKKILAPGAAL